MNKSIKILIGVIVSIIMIWGIIFLIDYSNVSNLKMPIFVIETDKNENATEYLGLGYKVKVQKTYFEKDGIETLSKIEMYIFNKFVTGSISNINSNLSNNDNDISHKRMLMVAGKLYYDSDRESNITERCGNMDGYITSNTALSETPKINNQANFEGDYGYQFIDENTIEVFINNKWYIFETKD